MQPAVLVHPPYDPDDGPRRANVCEHGRPPMAGGDDVVSLAGNRYPAKTKTMLLGHTAIVW